MNSWPVVMNKFYLLYIYIYITIPGEVHVPYVSSLKPKAFYWVSTSLKTN